MGWVSSIEPVLEPTIMGNFSTKSLMISKEELPESKRFPALKNGKVVKNWIKISSYIFTGILNVFRK